MGQITLKTFPFNSKAFYPVHIICRLMQAIVLAAGEGSRMRPLTARRPKVMLPVAGKPLLEHILRRAQAAGVDNFIFVVGYGENAVRSHFSDGSDLGTTINYAHQDEQLGTGHALMAAESLAEEQFLVLNGDILPDISALKQMIQSGVWAAAARRVPDPSRYGVFLTDGGAIKRVIEKSEEPPSDLANAGIYLFKRDIFEVLHAVALSERGEYELTDGLNLMAGKEKISLVELSEWMEIGRPWDILSASEALLPGIEPQILGKVEPGATLTGNISVGRGTVIRSGAYLTGPIFIGENCDIGPNCYIRPGTCLGDQVRVGNAVEVKNSTIMTGTKIGHLSYVGDSVIGENCNFGAGTVISNLRHDRRTIRSYIKGQPVDSGRRKLGAIIGDGTKTGINTTIYPGTVIESGFRGLPAAILKGLLSTHKAG
jgi:UDP-N-acetylglucosamine diphosphorylase/glucosamine-1-phosphate N-acetyltransferase